MCRLAWGEGDLHAGSILGHRRDLETPVSGGLPICGSGTLRFGHFSHDAVYHLYHPSIQKHTRVVLVNGIQKEPCSLNSNILQDPDACVAWRGFVPKQLSQNQQTIGTICYKTLANLCTHASLSTHDSFNNSMW